ncbi:nuclear transport factor 2 family protein [Methylovirgula sp. 4M-Z18]|uniref:nuclear transport factor 2 family protein n=1 Tax=Methylovirgula sp. 4M-Z18 TaxID=2293567 RepID=UPI001FE0CCA3|nr:nuclear transport factor 2 family protein [Methylovirgula sp. 4M-Z18]
MSITELNKARIPRDFVSEREMTIDPVALTAAYHAAINALDFEMVDGFFAANVVYHSDGIGSLYGRASVMSSFKSYFERFADQTATDEKIEQMDPRAARAIWTLTATDTSTGEPIQRRGEEIVTFDEAGTIIKVYVVDY